MGQHMNRTVSICFLALLPSVLLPREEAPFPPPPANVSSVVELVSDSEPGQRLVITGTVYKADGKTPFAGLVLYLYQTDATGVYNNKDGSWQRPRIHGWVKADREGRYEIRTIKPGSYPRSRIAAHIHAIVKLDGEEAKWIDDFLFAGDEFLSEKEKSKLSSAGSLSAVMKENVDKNGVLHCRRDIVIRTGE